MIGPPLDPAFWKGRRVFLTGHTGFKGAWLSLWLQSLGARVTGFSSGVATEPSLFELARVEADMTSVTGDIRDLETLATAMGRAKPELVIHMAAQSLVRHSFADPRGTYEVNVMGTVNVLEAVRSQDSVRAVVVVTSDKCYLNREWDWGYRENEPLGGHDPYSSSKAAAELVTSAYRDSFFAGEDSARLATARAGNVIGGGDWAADRLIPDIMRAALVDEAIQIRNPGSIRPWQHVLCPLSGYLLLAQSLFESSDHARAYNFGPADEDARTVEWVLQRICDRWPEQLRVQIDPGPHPHEARYLKLDSSLARARLGWRPTLGLEEGIEATVEWYRRLREGEDARAVTLEQIGRYAG